MKLPFKRKSNNNDFTWISTQAIEPLKLEKCIAQLIARYPTSKITKKGYRYFNWYKLLIIQFDNASDEAVFTLRNCQKMVYERLSFYQR